MSSRCVKNLFTKMQRDTYQIQPLHISCFIHVLIIQSFLIKILFLAFVTFNEPRKRGRVTMAGVSGPGPAVAILSMRFLKISSLLSARSSKISLSLARRSLKHTHKHRRLHDFSIRLSLRRKETKISHLKSSCISEKSFENSLLTSSLTCASMSMLSARSFFSWSCSCLNSATCL